MNHIKALIFDLDDTLLDTSGQLKQPAYKRAVEKMVEAGLPCSVEEGVALVNEFAEKKPRGKRFQELSAHFGKDLAHVGEEQYKNDLNLDALCIDPKVKTLLSSLKKTYTLCVVSTGSYQRQMKKIEKAGLHDYFDIILIDEEGRKESFLAKIKKKLGLHSKAMVMIGDRLDVDIASANRLGMTSIRVTTGAYGSLLPSSKEEEPDYTLSTLLNLTSTLSIIEEKEDKLAKGPKIVVLGGGTGCPTLLEGLKNYTHNLAAVVTVTDRGRSSGKLHDEFGVLPPGDIRNNLVALSDSEAFLHELFQYRFETGALEGHSFGNLLLVALTKVTGSFANALEQVDEILNLQGEVLPSTYETTELCATLEDGTALEGEQAIVRKGDATKEQRPPIQSVSLSPSVKANPKVLEAIEQADLVVIGPGSLYTSVMPNLLLEGMKEALQKAGKVVFVCNIMTQAGQTTGYSARKHIEEIKKYAGRVDKSIVNTGRPPKEVLDMYLEEHATLIEPEEGEDILQRDIVEDVKEKQILWEKTNLLRHNAEKIAEVLMELV